MSSNRFKQLGFGSTQGVGQNQKNKQLQAQYYLAESLSKKTHFTTQEILSLFFMYQKLTLHGKMDRLRFREVLHTVFDVTDDTMLDRIFRAFDTNNDSLVDEVEWVAGLSIILKGTLEQAINFCYYVYDINGDRSLAREELYHCLKNCLIKTVGIEEDIEESIKDIVEMAMKKLDVDRNGQITFSDFQAAVQSDPLLLEACGPCLPSATATTNFLSTFQNEYPVQWKSLNHILSQKKPKAKQRSSSVGEASRKSSTGWAVAAAASRLSVSPPRKLQFTSPNSH